VLTLQGSMRAIALAVLCVSSTALAAPKLASHYAPLFEKGKTFTYALSVTNFDYVEKKDGTYKSLKMKPELSTFTCTVTGVIAFADAVASTIQCDREIDTAYSFRVDGTWVATKAGVWRTGGDTLPASAAEIELMPKPPMRANPQVASKRTKDDYGGFYTESVTSPRKGTWCTTADTTKAGAGDGAIETVCFTAGKGVSRGLFDYYGGTPRVVEYKLQ
jgi:hypothetical protein